MKKISNELLVATSQYITTYYTEMMLESLKEDGVLFTSLVVCDGTPEERMAPIRRAADICIIFKEPLHSLPELMNILLNFAKTSDSKFVLYSHSDIIFRKNSLKSMLKLIKDYNIVSPIKIDGEERRFKEYKPISNRPVQVVGFNDSTFMFRTEDLDFNLLDRYYGPYQFEITDLGYYMWKKGYSSVVDPFAVTLHRCSQDIQYCPEERKDSENWDKKKEYFLNKTGEDGKWFMEKSVMNSEIVKDFGFPVFVKENNIH